MKFLKSTLGLKVIMALSGIVLIGFVVVHMLGNLQIFIPYSGSEEGGSAIDKYAMLLKSNALVLWGARLTLLGSVCAHIYAAVVLTQRSNAARPRDYMLRRWFSESYAVRTMRWGGVILLLFIIYHLLHLTVGVGSTGQIFTDIKHCTTEACFVRQNVIDGFDNPFISLFYIISQCALGLHLSHGVWSLFRTLGVTSTVWNTRSKMLALSIGGLITLGNTAIPLAVLMDIIN